MVKLYHSQQPSHYLLGFQAQVDMCTSLHETDGVERTAEYWCQFSQPSGRGWFHCKIPSAANPSVNQTLYANIGEFIINLSYLIPITLFYGTVVH